MSTTMKRTAASVRWFDIPADNLERAKSFYTRLFNWKIEPFPAMPDYWHIDTGGEYDSPDGGLMARQHPQQTITQFISVDSVQESAAKVEELGGEVCVAKTAVPEAGYYAICKDTEGNPFGLWQSDHDAR